MKLSRLITLFTSLITASLLLSGCIHSTAGSTQRSSDNKHLTVFISADTNIEDLWKKHLIPAFEKANPGYSVSVNFDLHGQHDQQTVNKLTAASAQHQDPGFDLVDAGFVTQLANSGLLAEVDAKNVPGIKDVPQNLVQAGGHGGVPYRGSSVVLAYNTQTVPRPPETLTELLDWIKSNPGKFAYCSPDTGGSGQAFVTTVLDQTIPPAVRAKMETSDVPDAQSYWEKGFATLVGLNPSVYQKGVYPNGNNQVLDLLSSGQISLAPAWSDQFVTGRKTGQIPANIAYTQISDPSFTGGASYVGIPKSSPRQQEAYKLLSWLLTPDAQALMANSVSGYPVIPLAKLPASVQETFKNADITHLRPGYVSSLSSEVNKEWAEKVPGK